MKLLQTKGETLTLAYDKSQQSSFGRRPQEKDLKIAKNLCFVVDKHGFILWQGPRQKLPKDLYKKIRKEVSLKPATYMPAFVEAHTHLIFAGDRQNEFEMRNGGATYQQIAEGGGGIAASVKHTRAASSAKLLELARRRVWRFAEQGVGVLEAKTGYGLSWKEEKKLLNVIQKLAQESPLTIVPTYLGPHAKSPEFNTLEEYINDIVHHQISQVAKLKIPRADIFIEKGYFTLEQGEAYLKALKDHGISFSVHADQMSRTGSGAMAVKMGAQSIDHCVCLSDADIAAVAQSSTVAMLLPAADFYIKIPYPQARKLIDLGALVALATDFNPGSSPTQNLSFVGVLARLEMKMSLVEVLFSYTLNAARALGKQDEYGSLQPGKRLNLICLESDWTELFYQVGYHPVGELWVHGQKVKSQK